MGTNNSWNNTAADAAVSFNGGLSVATTGIVTNTKQPAFSVVPAVDQSNATGDATMVTVVFGTTVFDQASNFDGVSTFTAPTTGTYFFTGCIAMNGLTASHTSSTLSIVTTSETYDFVVGSPGSMRDGNNSFTAQFSHYCKMTAGNTMYVTIVVSNGTKVVSLSSTAGSSSALMGYLVC